MSSTHVFNALAVLQSITEVWLRVTPETDRTRTAFETPQPLIRPGTAPMRSPWIAGSPQTAPAFKSFACWRARLRKDRGRSFGRNDRAVLRPLSTAVMADAAGSGRAIAPVVCKVIAPPAVDPGRPTGRLDVSGAACARPATHRNASAKILKTSSSLPGQN